MSAAPTTTLSATLGELRPPQENPDFVGYDATQAHILSRLASGRMPHALLISGHKGLGKATLAYRIARYLLAGGNAANASNDADSSGGVDLFGAPIVPEKPVTPPLYIAADHPTFRRVAGGSHGDLMVLHAPPGEDISVEQARQVGKFLSLTPSESQWRIVIIDPAEAMNRNAANALLKVLEEPPPQALLLLVSHQPARLLPTIRSRCQRVVLPPLDAPAFHTLLEAIAPELAAATPTESPLGWLSDHAPGQAAWLAEHGALECYQELLALFAQAPKADLLALQHWAEEHSGKDAAARWPVIVMMLTQLLARLVYAASGVEFPPLSDEESPLLAKLVAAKPLDYWLRLWDKAGHLLADVDALNLDKKHVLQSVLMAILRDPGPDFFEQII